MSLEYTRVVLSPALAWYPNIRRALNGMPVLAHQLKTMQTSDYLITTDESNFCRWQDSLQAHVLSQGMQEWLEQWSTSGR